MNNDLISRSALKNDLKQYFTVGVLDGVSAKLAFNQILHDIDNAPSVEVGYLTNCANCEKVEKIRAKRPQGKWIPVSERLPEKGNQSYLVTVEYGEGIICSCQRFFFNDAIGWNDDCVIAWQPLPEPYKRGANNG